MHVRWLTHLALTRGSDSSPAYDISSALISGGLSSLLQVIVFSRNSTGNSTGLLRVTGNISAISLPYNYPNGTSVVLGDDDNPMGYPPALYPNITYNTTSSPDVMDPSVTAQTALAFQSFPLTQDSILMLGPVQVNSSYALISMTLPIIDLTDSKAVLGFMTIVAAATSLIDVTNSREGLSSTGIVLLVGSNRRPNQFSVAQRPVEGDYVPAPRVLNSAIVKYIFPPDNASGRHDAYTRNLSLYGSSNFSESAYPAVLEGFGKPNQAINHAGSMLSTKNENNVSVSVGFARPNTTLVDWLLIVEQSHKEAWEPITKLRRIVLACVFGTMGFIILVVLPMAHFSVRPIRRLRDATEKSISPPGYTPNGGSIRSERQDDEFSDGEMDLENPASSQRSKKGILVRLKNLTTGRRRKSKIERSEDERRRVFKIPAKVPDRKHWVTDELTELTSKFTP